MWLKANQGTSSVSNNAAIDKWVDASGNNIAVTQTNTNKQPIYVLDSSLNGYPAIKFDKTSGSNHLLSGPAAGLDGTAGVTIFSVVRKNGAVNSNKEARSIISKRDNVDIKHSFMFFFYTNNNLFIDYEGTNDRFFTPQSFDNNKKLLVSTMFDGSLTSDKRATIYEGNTLLKTSKETSNQINANNAPVVIGATHISDNRPFEGLIAEVITYRIALNETQRIIVNNYLSSKYNVSLTDSDLYKMDNASNGNFDHEMIGIGSLSSSDNHLVAQGSGIVEVSNASDLDGKFLLFGHNNSIQQAVNTTDVPTTFQARFDRVWRMSSVTSAGIAASVGTVSLQFDLSNLGNVDATNLRLMISTTGSFASSTPISGATLVSGNIYRFDNVPTEDANYFTLGTTNTIVTPLPITLIDFTAEKEARTVVLNWSTASEKNNDRFEIERTEDGINWEVIATVKGNNHSSSIFEYATIDSNPKAGTNYYRLKQIDYNGSSTTSIVRSVTFNMPVELTVYPNPANDIVNINRGENSNIQLINDLGQTVYVSQEISENSTTLDLSNLNSGVYFIRIQEEEQVITKKLIRL